MIRITYLISVVILFILPLTGSATDGDVVYSAPYIWVNPETGQIEMKNPGPQLKNHENPAVDALVSTVMAAEEISDGSGNHASEEAGEAVAHTNPVHTVIVLAGMIATVSLIVIMGRKA